MAPRKKKSASSGAPKDRSKTSRKRSSSKGKKRRKKRSKKVEALEDSAGLGGDVDGSLDDDEERYGEVLVGELVDDDEEADEEEYPDENDVDSAASDAHHRLVKHDPLSAYVQETKRYPLLSREEEKELAVRVLENGDAQAARRLIESNLRLVVKIAYEYRRAHRNLLDLIQEGNIGLMHAVTKYDPYRGVKLSSYAAWWIRAYILKFVLNNWRLVKIGTTQAQRKLFFNLRKEKERLLQLGFQPTPALLAESLDVNEKDVVEMEKRMAAPDASLDAPLPTDDENGPRTRMESLTIEDEERPDLQVAQGEVNQLFQDKLEEFGQTLEGRDAAIYYERMLAESPLTLQQIGDRYDISRERARQLEKRLLSKLRDFLEEEIGTAVDIEAMINE